MLIGVFLSVIMLMKTKMWELLEVANQDVHLEQNYYNFRNWTGGFHVKTLVFICEFFM